jgi:hypothetical protein
MTSSRLGKFSVSSIQLLIGGMPMTIRSEFTQHELAVAIEERRRRLLKTAEYKKTWHSAKRERDGAEGRAKAAQYQREWREKNRDKARKISKEANARYVDKNPTTRRKSARDYNARRRSELLAFFGGSCVRCGFADPRALHLDHISGGGKVYRDAGRHGLHEKWKMTRDDPDGARAIFQILCANCNFIKRDEDYEYGSKIRLAKAVTDAIS